MSEAASARPISGGAAGGACDGESAFICNICLDITDKEPVVTQCGHLYCWTCLYRWLNTNHTTCPVCKAGITQENIIPLFIRGENQDPRKIGTNVNNNTDNTEGALLLVILATYHLLTYSLVYSGDAVPNRPQGRRPEPTAGAATGNNMNAQFGNMSFSVGFGFFPSLFGLQFQNFTPVQPQTGRPLTPEEIEQQKLSRVLMGIGIIVLSALLFL
jgi:E3 ubiquitin-protein ligase RNF5